MIAQSFALLIFPACNKVSVPLEPLVQYQWHSASVRVFVILVKAERTHMRVKA